VNENNAKNNLVRVAIIHTSNHKPEELEKALKAHDIDIVTVAQLSSQCLTKIDPDTTDAILVDLHDNAEQELDILETLLEDSHLPLLFNDNATTQFNISISSTDWSEKLASKLHSLSAKYRQHTPRIDLNPVSEDAPIVNELDIPEVIQADPIISEELLPIIDQAAELQIDSFFQPDMQLFANHTVSAEKVWVLGASLGGPVAVREFLSCLPEDLPIAFILAQHIGASHIELLGEQLDRATTFNVKTAKQNHIIQDQDVILAPIEEKIIINSAGSISLSPLTDYSIYTPSIDAVLIEIANRYGPQAGTIIFSGMGNDGEKGCQEINEKGGVVWAQEPETCVISSMPDSARKTGCVTFSDTPQGLAIRLVEYLVK